LRTPKAAETPHRASLWCGAIPGGPAELKVFY